MESLEKHLLPSYGILLELKNSPNLFKDLLQIHWSVNANIYAIWSILEQKNWFASYISTWGFIEIYFKDNWKIQIKISIVIHSSYSTTCDICQTGFDAVLSIYRLINNKMNWTKYCVPK